MKASKSKFYYFNVKNKLKLFKDNPKHILFYVDRFMKYNSLKDFSTFIISYPKSGRTWLQKMIVEAVRLEYHLENEILDVSSLSKHTAHFPSMLSTHAKSSWEELIRNQEEIKKDDFDDYKHARSIFLIRDPRDVLVSQYYHIKLRTAFSTFDKTEMILNPNVGIYKIIHFMNKWLSFTHQHPDKITMISYEEMKADANHILSSFFNWFDIPISKENVDLAVERCSLKNMKKNQSSEANNNPWTKTNDKKNENSFQTRKGLIGEHKDFFSSEELKTIEQVIADNLDPRFPYFNN